MKDTWNKSYFNNNNQIVRMFKIKIDSLSNDRCIRDMINFCIPVFSKRKYHPDFHSQNQEIENHQQNTVGNWMADSIFNN